MEFGNLFIRPFQLLFLAVVLGLSINLVRKQFSGSAPSETSFAVACGVFGTISMLVGLAAVFVESLQGLVMLVLDGISTLFFFAGSIALAVKLGVHSCTSRPDGWNDESKGNPFTPPNPYCAYNSIINGGAVKITDADGAFDYYKDNSWFVSRCRQAQALDAFLFFSLAAFAASLAMDVLGFRRGKTASY